MTKGILVIDSETKVFEAIRNKFQNETTQVFHILTVEAALKNLNIHNYSLIILDALLLDHSLYETIAAMRELKPMPILVLSENSSTADRLLALEAGADDCIEHSGNMEECFVRAKVLLRRYTKLNHITQHSYAMLCHKNLLLDTGRRMVSINGKETALSPKEFGILLCLMKNKNRILTFEQLYEIVWNQLFLGDNAAICYHVGSLRRKLGPQDWIESVYGVGYRLRSLGMDHW